MSDQCKNCNVSDICALKDIVYKYNKELEKHKYLSVDCKKADKPLELPIFLQKRRGAWV